MPGKRSEHGASQLDKISGQEVAKVVQAQKVAAKLAKTDARYWLSRLFRNTYGTGEDTVLTRDWCARIARAGQREINPQLAKTDSRSGTGANASSTFPGGII